MYVEMGVMRCNYVCIVSVLNPKQFVGVQLQSSNEFDLRNLVTSRCNYDNIHSSIIELIYMKYAFVIFSSVIISIELCYTNLKSLLNCSNRSSVRWKINSIFSMAFIDFEAFISHIKFFDDFHKFLFQFTIINLCKSSQLFGIVINIWLNAITSSEKTVLQCEVVCQGILIYYCLNPFDDCTPSIYT